MTNWLKAETTMKYGAANNAPQDGVLTTPIVGAEHSVRWALSQTCWSYAALLTIRVQGALVETRALRQAAAEMELHAV